MPEGARPFVRNPVASALLLAVACVALHASALTSGWAFDDPAHLRFATHYSPWQYFTQREVMLQQSYAHISPWNALFYDLGLPWAGLNAVGHHVHLLVVVWACAWATWWLVRRFTSDGMALGAATLWLAWPGTATIAHCLMTGHYAYGLLFSILAMLAFDRALTGGGRRHAVAASGWCGMASLCKELYVPLVAVLHVWPRATTVRRRLAFGWPLLVVSAGYVGLRTWVLGGIGGYAALHSDVAAAPIQWKVTAIRLIYDLRRAFGGEGSLGMIVVVIVGSIIATAVFRTIAGVRVSATASTHVRRIVFVMVAVVALAVPVLPVYSFDLPYGRERVLLAIGWSLAVGLAWGAKHVRGSVWWLAALIPLVIPQQRVVQRNLATDHRVHSAELAWLAEADAGEILVPESFHGLGYFEDMIEARREHHGAAVPGLVHDVETLMKLPRDRGRAAWAWNKSDRSVAPLGDEFDRRVEDVARRLAAGAGRPLSVELSLEVSGRHRVFRWSVSGTPGRLWLDVPHAGRRVIPREGSLAFGMDHTAPLGWGRTSASALATAAADSVLEIYVTVEASDGAWVRSPPMSLPLTGRQFVRWSQDEASGVGSSE